MFSGTFGVQGAPSESMVLPITAIEQPTPGHKLPGLKPDGKFGTCASTGATPKRTPNAAIAATTINLEIDFFVFMNPPTLLAVINSGVKTFVNLVTVQYRI